MDSRIRLLDKANGQLLAEFKGHSNTQFRITNCFGDNDSYVIGGSEDGNVYVWDLLEGTVVANLENHEKSITTVQHNPKRKEFISGSLDGKIGVWVDDNLFAQHMETTKPE
jgi:mitogen-activated protein kinase organizer 1